MRRKEIPSLPGNNRKIFYGIPHPDNPIPMVSPAVDKDLGLENLINDYDLTPADLQDP